MHPSTQRPIHRRLAPILIALAAASAVAQPPPPQIPLEVVLARTLEAYGGAEAWSRLRSLRQSGQITSALRGHGTVERAFAFPDRLRVESRFPEAAGEVRILAGEDGWRNGEVVAGPPYLAMVLQAARLALPRLLLEGRERLLDLGPAEGAEGSLRLLALPLRQGARLEIEIDLASGRILRSRGRVGQLVFETRYSDFRPVPWRPGRGAVGQLLFAFREETRIMDQPASRTELAEIILDEPLGPELFAP